MQIGQGLGKNSEGYAEPIKVDIKLNRKGLVSQNENKTNHESPIVHSCGKRVDLKILLLETNNSQDSFNFKRWQASSELSH